jgi:glutamate/aspartate transport system substrate-binding protein
MAFAGGYESSLATVSAANAEDIMPAVKFEYSGGGPERIPLVQNGTVGCGPTTSNKTRQQQVAFALTTYVRRSSHGDKIPAYAV